MNKSTQPMRLLAVSVGLATTFVVASILGHRKAVKARKNAEKVAKDWDEWMKNLESIETMLDKKLEVAKFWDIVTREG